MTTVSIDLKPRIQNLPTLPPPGKIAFCHPGYNSPYGILFQLPRLDTAGPGLTGVSHFVALRACQIVANNAYDGFIATDRAGCHRLRLERDTLLTERQYWFFANYEDHNGDAQATYPIVPSFQDWAFPHDRFQELEWRNLAPASENTRNTPVDSNVDSSRANMPPPSALQPIRRCAVTKISYAIHSAHLIPGANYTWFRHNNMMQYGSGDQSVHNASNSIDLTNTLHAVWDDHIFAFLPKGPDFVIHVLAVPSVAALEFAAKWHNIPIGTLDGTADEYMFARFAQAVFMVIKPFVANSAVQRRVARLRAKQDANGKETDFQVTDEWLSADALQEQYAGGGSRSASASRKRSHSRATDGDSDMFERNVRMRAWSTSSDEEECCCDEKFGSEEEQRGRSLERRPEPPPRLSSGRTVDTTPSLTDSSVDVVDECGPNSLQSSGLLPHPDTIDNKAASDNNARQAIHDGNVEVAAELKGCHR